MDPLSVSAAVIGFLAFSGASAQGLRRLIHHAVHAPSEVVALANEVSDLALVVSDIEATLRTSAARATDRVPVSPQFVEGVERHVAKARAKLLALDKLLGTIYVQKHDEPPKLLRHKWLVHKDAAQALIKDISDIKTSLSVLLASFTAFHTLSINLFLAGLQIHERSDFVSSATPSPLSRIEDIETPTVTEATADSSHYVVSKSSKASVTTQSVQFINDDDQGLAALLQVVRQIGQFATLTFQLHRIVKCNGYCACQCHHRREVTSPAFLDHILGRLFIGYAGLPIWSQNCNIKNCLNQYSRAMQVSYSFPKWFLSKTLDMVFALTQMNEPCFGIKVRNRTAEGENSIYHLARNGDFNGIIELFKKRHVSPNDISYRLGYTPVHFALELGHSKVVQLLINAGVDLHHHDDYGHTDALTISETILSPKRRNPGASADLADIFANMQISHEEIWDFTLLHLIVVGELQLDLAEALRNPDRIAEIDVPDCRLRTPLIWASMNGMPISVRLLLEAGADMMVRDAKGITPMTAAVQSGNLKCVEVLLAAGASIHSRDNRGHTALQMASWTVDDPEYLRALLLAGASLDIGNERMNTPLQTATCLNHYRNGAFLIESGANMENKDCDGATPISEAIRYDSLEMLQVLLRKGARLDQVDNAGQTLLHIIAIYGTKRCIEALAGHEKQLLDPGLRDSQGRTAHDAFQRRVVKPPGVEAAFFQLLDSLEENIGDDHEDLFFDVEEHM